MNLFNRYKKVAIALSGGVDSSVSAVILKEKGYKLFAVHAVCFNEKDSSFCNAKKDREDAIRIAEKLNIPIKIYDLTKEYKKQVLDEFYFEYNNNRTPNPDVLCNKDIKFSLLMEKAFIDLKVNYYATGHYAALNEDHKLCIPKDANKDQTYFLSLVKKDTFKKVMFPLNNMTKEEVRKKAKDNNLFNYDKKDSQGICFVGEVKIKDFLKDKVKTEKGVVMNLKGEVIGAHTGLAYYTIGQRHGFTLTTKVKEPMYVIKKDIKNNILVVDAKKHLESEEFLVRDVNYSVDINDNEYLVRIRHLGEFYRCNVKVQNNNIIKVLLKNNAIAVASGQIAVFYKNNIVQFAGYIC